MRGARLATDRRVENFGGYRIVEVDHLAAREEGDPRAPAARRLDGSDVVEGVRREGRDQQRANVKTFQYRLGSTNVIVVRVR